MNGLTMILVIFGILIVSAIGTGLIKKQVFTGIYSALQQQDYATFLEKVDSTAAKMFLPVYTRENMRLQAFIKQDQGEQVKEQFNLMMKMKLNSCQKSSLLTQGFRYYLKKQDRKKCGQIVMEMKNCMVEEQWKKYERHYEIIFAASTEYIGELEKEIPNHRSMMKGYLEYLLAYSYRAAGKEEKCREYLRKAAGDYKTCVSRLDSVVQVL